MLPQARRMASGSFVLSNRSRVGCRAQAQVPYASKREQFWGRAVQASRDSLDPGLFLFAVKFPKDSQSFRRFTLAHILLITFPNRL
jgi:hypothetical protein